MLFRTMALQFCNCTHYKILVTPSILDPFCVLSHLEHYACAVCIVRGEQRWDAPLYNVHLFGMKYYNSSILCTSYAAGCLSIARIHSHKCMLQYEN